VFWLLAFLLGEQPCRAQHPSHPRCFAVTYHFLGRYLRQLGPGSQVTLGPPDTAGVPLPLRDSIVAADSLAFRYALWPTTVQVGTSSDSARVRDSIDFARAKWPSTVQVEAASDTMRVGHTNGYEVWYLVMHMRGDSLTGTADYWVDGDPFFLVLATLEGSHTACR